MPGHHEVDDHEVGPAGLEAAEGLGAVARGDDRVAVVAQLVGEEHEEARVVVDDEDAREDPRPGSCGEYRWAPRRV